MPGAGSIIDAICPLTNHPLNRGLLIKMRVTPNSGWRGGLTFRDLRRGQHKPNDGTLTGTVKWQGGGPGSSGSLNFDGSTGYVIDTSFANQPQGNSPISMSAWVRFTNTATAIEIVSFTGIDAAGGNQAYFLYRNASGKAVSEFGSGTGAVTGATTLVANTWYWLCAVYNGATNSIFVNGVSDATPTTYSAANLTGTRYIIAAYQSGLSVPLLPAAANIDDFCIFDHALSSPYAIYQELKAGSPNTINWVDYPKNAGIFMAPAAVSQIYPYNFAGVYAVRS